MMTTMRTVVVLVVVVSSAVVLLPGVLVLGPRPLLLGMMWSPGDVSCDDAAVACACLTLTALAMAGAILPDRTYTDVWRENGREAFVC